MARSDGSATHPPYAQPVDDFGKVLLGALIALAAGLIAAAVEGRREHHKWLRNARLAACIDTLRAVDHSGYDISVIQLGTDPATGRTKEPADELLRTFGSHTKEMMSARAALLILGPPGLADAAEQFISRGLDLWGAAREHVPGAVPTVTATDRALSQRRADFIAEAGRVFTKKPVSLHDRIPKLSDLEAP
jgi:hypothetical protein